MDDLPIAPAPSPKQVIVVRKDLNMRKGKMCAQASHAAMKGLLAKWKALRLAIYQAQNCLDNGGVQQVHEAVRQAQGILDATEHLSLAESAWYNQNFRKVCLYVESEAALVGLHEAALAKGLTSHLIEDHGLTEFHGVPTKTCIAIGPHFDEDFIGLTDHLPLL